jgi:hypothetical protein
MALGFLKKRIFDYNPIDDSIIEQWAEECFLLESERQEDIDDILFDWLEQEDIYC